MRKAVIVAAARTPVGKANRGALVSERPEDLGKLVLNAVVDRAGIDKGDVDDIIVGCAFPEAEQGMNMGRIVAMHAGFPDSVPGFTINRFCSSGIESIAIAASRIQNGWNDVIIAGGIEHMSRIPMGGNKIRICPSIAEESIESYTGMGTTAENVVLRYGEEFNLTREELDAFGLNSNKKALKALEDGVFKDQYVPVPYKKWAADGMSWTEAVLEQDEGPRATTVEKMAKLRPVFRAGGVVTAANSSQMNDGAAFLVVVAEEYAKDKGLEILAEFGGYQVAGCAADEMGVGPAYAIPKLKDKFGFEYADIDLWEINEAFASQALYSIRKIGIEQYMDRINVNGGAIALGHPLGCTGAKLSTQLLYEMKRRDAKKGIVSMCIGGGMGAAGLIVRP